MLSFDQYMQEETLTRINKDDLVEVKVSATLSYVVQALRSNNRPDPRLDADGKTCFILQEKFRGYLNQYGTKLKQKALPMMVLRKCWSSQYLK